MEEEKSSPSPAAMDCGESPAFHLPQLWVHPTTLVSIGEHGARLLYNEEGGGAESGSSSASPTSSMGLLWGIIVPNDENQSIIEVWDAEDAPHGDGKPLERVIDPLQVVVGWYRIAPKSNAAEKVEDPSPEDLQRSQQWKQRYSPNSTVPFLFALSSNRNGHLSFYMLHQHPNSSVLLSLDDHWSLRTAPSERLGVERLFHVTPPAWRELDARLQPLQEVLQQQQDSSGSNTPESAALRRQIQGLLDHLALCPSSRLEDSRAGQLLPTLAALAQCVAATQPYLEKQRMLLPTTSSSDPFPESSSRDRRGPAGDRGGMPWRMSRRFASGTS